MHDVGGGQWWRAGSHACHPASSCYCSAEPLLADPALFSARRAQQPFGHLDGVQLLLEYCDLLDLHPQPWRMVRSMACLLGRLQAVMAQERDTALPALAQPVFD